jgi:uncharacterized protein (TIGR02118 family)
MINVSVLYPNQEGAKFDLTYYLNKHTPLVKERLGAALKRASIDVGINGGAADSRPPYFVICNLTFDSVDAFNAAFAPHAAEILGDIPNYTDVKPLIQVSDIRLAG